MSINLMNDLATFARDKNFRGKGSLCVALVVTQHAMTMGLPLDSNALFTDSRGQVLGLGKSPVQSILNQYGITRILASEGGRTSRGSIGNMQEYVAFLNALAKQGSVDLKAIEKFWIAQVEEFFAAKPFKIKLDSSKSLRTVVRDVLAQAEERHKSVPGTSYAGAVLQHLVGAKLDCALGIGFLSHHSSSTADAPTGRVGDFFIGDVAIHVTTSPSEALIERCRDNLNDGVRPIVVTLQRGLTVAEALACNANIGDRVDVFEIEQFVALNLYEIGKFAASGRQTAISDVIERYNAIVDECETDPSLKIELRQ